MFEKFSRSWQLVKASGAVLRQDKSLLVFPAISSVAALLVAITFFLPLVFTDALMGAAEEDTSPLFWGWMFLFYLTQYFVIFFFNTALVAAAMIRLDGGQPSLAAGLNVALSRVGSLFVYALIAATVGVILRALAERFGFVGRLVLGMIGLAWTVATFLVVPILATRQVGALDAVKESAGLLKQTWGENLIGQSGIGLVFALIHVALVLLTLGLVGLALAAGSAALVALAVAAGVIAIMVAALIQAALTGIYSAALYRHATGQPNPQSFDDQLLNTAFQVKA